METLSLRKKIPNEVESAIYSYICRVNCGRRNTYGQSSGGQD